MAKKKKQASRAKPRKPAPDEVSEEAAAKIERIIAAGLAELEARSSRPAPRGESKEQRRARADEELAGRFLSSESSVPTVNLEAFEVSPDVLRRVPRAFCEEHQLLPVNVAGTTLVVAMRDPRDRVAIEALAALTGLDVEPVQASAEAISDAIERSYPA